jgi:imidazolonepropionase-like amidohydrolase
MVELGMAPHQAIESATRCASEFLGVSDRLGTLEPGKRADLVIVEGDPLVDIAAIGRPWLVMVEGRIVRDGPSPTANELIRREVS